MEFGPDTAFGVVTLRNDEAATAFLREHSLEEGKFLCCIPRYRWTPFWTIHKERAADPVKLARNHEMKEHDHAPLRDAIIAVTRETGMKVLVTCEDQTQIQLGKEMLVDPLPADVKKKVVWRDRYWLTDEALSTYVRSAGLFGNEMHSPIMCISSGIPAVVCRFDEQTNKGFMWHDIGLNDWLFTLDNPAESRPHRPRRPRDRQRPRRRPRHRRKSPRHRPPAPGSHLRHPRRLPKKSDGCIKTHAARQRPPKERRWPRRLPPNLRSSTQYLRLPTRAAGVVIPSKLGRSSPTQPPCLTMSFSAG